MLQQLLQTAHVVSPHPARRVLPLPPHLGPDQLGGALFALLQVAQHVPYSATALGSGRVGALAMKLRVWGGVAGSPTSDLVHGRQVLLLHLVQARLEVSLAAADPVA